jgi:endonuclease YncB( thermonuclease family)
MNLFSSIHALSFVLFLSALSLQAETLTGYVVGIADGDTLTVLDASHQQHKIRLAGIDAPEKGQPFGDRSKQSLAAMAFNKNVTVEWNKLDRYGRTVGKVMVNGKDANLEQVRAGMAWWYRDYAKEQSPADRGLYERAEVQARAQHVGLWRDANPMPPWEFRHGGSAKVEQSCPCAGGENCTGPKGGHYCTTENGGKRYR